MEDLEHSNGEQHDAGPAHDDELAGADSAGEDERTDREEGGPTSPANEPEENVTGGGPSPKPDGGFDAHE